MAGTGGDGLAAWHALHAFVLAPGCQHDQAGIPGRLDRALVLLAAKSAALASADRPAEAMAVARRALAMAEQRAGQAGAPWLRPIRGIFAQLHFEAGRWDDALAELTPADDVPARGAGSADPVLDGLAALIAAHRDDWQAAGRRLRRAVSRPPDGTPAAMLAVLPAWGTATRFLLLARALEAERAGRWHAAAEVLAGCLDPGVTWGMPARQLALPALMRVSFAAGAPSTAAAAADAAASDAQTSGLPVSAAVAEHCRGLAAADPELLLRAAGYFQSAGRRLQHAQALEDAAAAAGKLGRAAAARRALAGALDGYESLGARLDARRAAARLRAYGIRDRRSDAGGRPAAGWDALTPAETRIARLAADGRSNPDIAAALHLSRNTVQTHISHILAKLGARSRAEIAGKAPTRIALSAD